MVAGLATLQDGHTRGGEQHSENSDTEHSHTRVGQAALVVVLLAVGHAGLASRVESFASSWDQRRGELSEQLGQVQTHLNTAVEGFRTTDTELAKALTEQASTYPPRTAQPQ